MIIMRIIYQKGITINIRRFGNNKMNRLVAFRTFENFDALFFFLNLNFFLCQFVKQPQKIIYLINNDSFYSELKFVLFHTGISGF